MNKISCFVNRDSLTLSPWPLKKNQGLKLKPSKNAEKGQGGGDFFLFFFQAADNLITNLSKKNGLNTTSST